MSPPEVLELDPLGRLLEPMDAAPDARARDRRATRALQAWLQAAGIQRGPVFRRMRRGDTLTEQRRSDQRSR